MDGYQDGQPDGAEPDDWQKRPLDVGPKPHGFFEPSKNNLLDRDYVRRSRSWRRLLDDPSVSNDVWWARLMRFLNG